MKKLLLLLPFLLLLVGCVQYDEELWLHRDGSGHAKMRVKVLSTYQNSEAVSRYAGLKGIHLLSFKTYRNKENTYYDVDLKFDNLDAFNALNDKESMANFVGKSTLTKDKNGILSFNRKISLGSTEFNDEDMMADLFQSIFTVNRNWSYTLHLPYEIISANADPSNVDYKNRTVKWNYEIAYLWNKDQTMEVTMDRKTPFIIFYIGLPALVLFLIIIFIKIWHHEMTKIFRKRPRKVKTPPPPAEDAEADYESEEEPPTT